jgi:hypothetical protein
MAVILGFPVRAGLADSRASLPTGDSERRSILFLPAWLGEKADPFSCEGKVRMRVLQQSSDAR